MFDKFLKLKNKENNKKGFTLIELLVVVAIIGILSSVVLASLNSAREKARDARRKSDLKQIQNALEMYYNDCGTYVVSLGCNGVAYGGGPWGGRYGGWLNSDYGSGSFAKGLVDTKSMSSLVVDPTGSFTGANAYMILVDKNKYTIWATLKNPSAQESLTINNCYFSDWDNYSGAGTQNYCLSN